MQNNEWKSITDPEELFKLKRQGWEIQVRGCKAVPWDYWMGIGWSFDWLFQARPRQPAMKKVVIFCYLVEKSLLWRSEEYKPLVGWIRVPSEDKEIEVPDND